MTKRRKLTSDEMLEVEVENSGYADARDLIDRIKSDGANPSEIVMWIAERDQFVELLYPIDDETSLVQAQMLWTEILALVIHEKGKLLYAAQQIINCFGGFARLLDVDYDDQTKQLVWKVKFSVD